MPTFLVVSSPDERRRIWIEYMREELEIRRREVGRVDRVAISFPGIVTREGTIYRANSIWGDATMDLPASELSARLEIDVTVMNDLTAAAARYGADPKYAGLSHVMVVSVSSGIGAKLFDVQARRVVLEPKGRNGEIAFALIDSGPDALLSETGKYRGILGNYSSGTATVRLARLRASESPDVYRSSLLRELLTSRGLDIATVQRHELALVFVECIRRGDSFSRGVLEQSIAHLAGVLHTILIFSSPDVLIVTGGFARAIGQWYVERLVHHMATRDYFMYSLTELGRMVTLGAADELDNLIGAGRLVASG